MEPSWKCRGTLPQGRPGPPRSLSGLRPQSFQLLGEKKTQVAGGVWGGFGVGFWSGFRVGLGFVEGLFGTWGWGGGGADLGWV